MRWWGASSAVNMWLYLVRHCRRLMLCPLSSTRRPPTHIPNTPQHHIHPIPAASQTLCGLPCFVSLWKETITHTGFLGLRDIVLTVYRNCIPLKSETEDFTRIKTKQKTKKRLFYYTSVSILTFWEIFFLFGELQHILFAEVSLQWKKRQKPHIYAHTDTFWTVTIKELLIVCF